MGREKYGWGNSNLTIVKILETVLMYELMVSYDIIVLLYLLLSQASPELNIPPPPFFFFSSLRLVQICTFYRLEGDDLQWK